MLKIILHTLFLSAWLTGGMILYAQDYDIWYTYPRTKNSKFSENRKFGLLDKNKNVVLPAVYDAVSDFYDGLARAVKNGKLGFVNNHNEAVIPFEYDEDSLMITSAGVTFRQHADGSAIDIVITIDEFRAGFQEGLAAVVKNGKYGFISKDNSVVIPFQYDGADNFYNGLAIVKQKEKFGVIDRQGTVVIPFYYDWLTWLFDKEPLLMARKDNACFFMNTGQKKIKDCNSIF
jgi:hypothetical protein